MCCFVGKFDALRHRGLTGLLAVALLAITPVAQAVQIIKDPKQPVNVQLKTDILGGSVKKGQMFEAQLQEELRCEEWTLPAGTVFRGEVTKVSPSKTLGRPGYVVLNPDEAQLPDGTLLRMDPSKHRPHNKKTHHKTSLTFTQTALQQLPPSALGLAVTLPLSITGTAGGLATIPAGLGTRMLAGSSFAILGGKKSKYHQKSVPEKVTYGALDGSGVIRLMGLMSKYPEPEYKAGETIKLYFNHHGLKEWFVASAKIRNNKAVPLEPEGPALIPQQQPNEPNNLVRMPLSPQQTEQTATFP